MLAAWAIPDEILKQAPENPWIHPPVLFQIPAVIEDSISHQRAREVLPESGSILDIGCGGGLFSEALAEQGAQVTGIDPSPGVIDVARLHMRESALEIDYQSRTAEDLAASGAQFDIVCAMEVLEHVVDMPRFVATAAQMVKPGGWFFAATLNRTLKSFEIGRAHV